MRSDVREFFPGHFHTLACVSQHCPEEAPVGGPPPPTHTPSPPPHTHTHTSWPSLPSSRRAACFHPSSSGAAAPQTGVFLQNLCSLFHPFTFSRLVLPPSIPSPRLSSNRAAEWGGGADVGVRGLTSLGVSGQPQEAG